MSPIVVSLDDTFNFNTFESGPAVELLMNDGRDEFSSFSPFFINDPSSFIDLADVDGEGLSDIVFPRTLLDDSNTTIGAELVTVLNDGSSLRCSLRKTMRLTSILFL